ncbi:MAG TPA: O-acetyl-ADP-ribose deacetylase [Steroidobacteraceae bacterium]
MNERDFLGGRVRLTTGDITMLAVDAIVNAANSTLLGGGGVDGAIHRRGGPEILEACKELRRTQYPDGLPPGEAVMTGAGKLPARFVVHTVGPIWGRDPDPDRLLASCYRRSIELAEAHSLRSIAFPAISTGAYGFPKDRAARVASRAIVEALEAAPSVALVQLVFFAPADCQLFIEHQQFG